MRDLVTSGNCRSCIEAMSAAGAWWWQHVSFWMGDWAGYPLPNILMLLVAFAIVAPVFRLMDSS